MKIVTQATPVKENKYTFEEMEKIPGVYERIGDIPSARYVVLHRFDGQDTNAVISMTNVCANVVDSSLRKWHIKNKHQFVKVDESVTISF